MSYSIQIMITIKVPRPGFLLETFNLHYEHASNYTTGEIITYCVSHILCLAITAYTRLEHVHVKFLLQIHGALVIEVDIFPP